MSSSPTYRTSRRKKYPSRIHPLGYYLARLMALATLVNFSWVLFDITYISFRDIYLAHLPWITVHYDKIKGIVPHRDTDQYLKTVSKFEALLDQKPLMSPEAGALLQELRTQSEDLVDANPFVLANKSGTLEKIKNRMRDRFDLDSAKGSFRKFWSQDYLASATQEKLNWFDRKISSLIATNYFRPISESGNFVDFFWVLDIGFVGLFAFDILIRMLMIRQRRPGITWTDALLWRWYDLFLLLPFWRFLRILPVLLRCHQVRWINLNRIQDQVNQYFAENLVEDLSELVLMRTFNVAQFSLKQGVLQKWLSTPTELVEINDVNELQVIIERVLTVIITKVLPQSQPELESVLRHAVTEAVSQVPVYKNLKFLPGASFLPNEITKQVVHQLTETTYATLRQTLKDEKGQELAGQLAQRMTDALRVELQDPKLLNELQQLLTDMLEEVKLTLIQSLDGQDVEQTATEVAKLKQKQKLSDQSPTIEVLPPRASLSSSKQNIS